MRVIKLTWLGVLIAALLIASGAQAEEDKAMGLFVNLTKFQTGQAGHALHMAGKQMERGHPVTFS
jgi:hypothetical protein